MAKHRNPSHHGLFGVHTVVDFATAFHRVANVLASNLTENSWSLLPMLMNESFALELYLKSLHLTAHGEMPRTHDLHDLFLTLPPDNQRGLKESYEGLISQPALREQASEHGHSKLEHIIFAHRSTFVDVRYFFEGHDPKFFRSLHFVLSATRDYIGRLGVDDRPQFKLVKTDRKANKHEGQTGVAEPKVMLQVARMFFGALNLLDARLADKDAGLLIIPFTVNSGFTFEICLKALSQITRNQYPLTHSLGKIFRHVPEKHRDGVLTLYRAGQHGQRPSFKRLLADSSDAFLDFRYGFEQTAYTYTFESPQPGIRAIAAYIQENWPHHFGV